MPFLESSASTLITAVTNGLSGVKDDAVSVISAVAPFGIAVVGTFIVVKLGVKAFKSISGGV